MPTCMAAPLTTKYILQPLQHPSSPSPAYLPLAGRRRSNRPLSTVHSGEISPGDADARPGKWAPDSWRSKKALQPPEYPEEARLEEVQKAIDIGMCAESFKEFKAINITDNLRVLLQMKVVLMLGGQMHVILVGRTAGQFAKPRSDQFEEKDGVKLPGDRGDIVNGDAFDEKTWSPDPETIIRAYYQSAATLNLLRAFATGGYAAIPAALSHATQWSLDFLRSVADPLGIKVSDEMDPNELVNLVDILNPENKPGRITVIVRMGAENLRAKLPHLIRAVRRSGQIVTWVSDPCGLRLKTRRFDDIVAEVRAFFDVHEQEGSYPGGIRLEMTGQNVTECIGGSTDYHTHCDPRLNSSQFSDLINIVSQYLQQCRMSSSSPNLG